MSVTSSDDDDDGFTTATDSCSDSEVGSNDFLHKSRAQCQAIEPKSSLEEGCHRQQNLLLMLRNREYARFNPQMPAFNKVPNRLRFCLKDIVPHCFVEGHMFMGVSACGNFLLSYKACINENLPANHYNFSLNYKYTLYFWIYQPYKPLRSFYKCCLFDDHGVDNIKEVTITQWKCGDPSVLIVHGAAEVDNEESYITYVKVPKLGCLDCKKLRELDDGAFKRYALCLKCNFTVHTKYSTTESDRKFDPYTNLICPGRILILANGFMHMLHIAIEPPTPAHNFQLSPQCANLNTVLPMQQRLHLSQEVQSNSDRRSVHSADDILSFGCDNQNNIVDRILADFSDVETDSTHSNGSRNNDMQRNTWYNDGGTTVPRKTYDELIFTCSASSSVASSGGNIASSINTSPSANSGISNKVSLVRHKGRRHHRIIKSYRNGIITVDMQAISSSPSASADKSNAYEFSEDNEKCEKIATLRKRRLADKKYEFSEDNTENIIPFTKIRSASKAFGTSLLSTLTSGSNTWPIYHRPSPTNYHFHTSPCASPSSSPHPTHSSDSRHCTPPPLHRASPISLQGFRSPPCSSPVSANVMRSPSRHLSFGHLNSQKTPPHSMSQATQQMLSFKPLGTLSPLQVSMTKRNYMDLSGSMSPNGSVPFLSPRREEHRVVEIPLQGGSMPEKPVCTKKFKRRYVEEDDAASVITSEEDDCISPGYHTSLPMEVHGSCYSEMHMISQSTYQQLCCASVVVTQHSFDLETFTYYVITTLCQKNNKTYDVFYDWAYELISVCPMSYTIICLLMAQFSARDQLPASPTNCLNCSRKLDCVFHRHQYECRILFTWNMEHGVWEVLDYGELKEYKPQDIISPIKKIAESLSQRAKKVAHEMSTSMKKIQDYSSNLRVLDSNLRKSKSSITDLDNMLEFYLKKPRNND